MGSSPQPHIFSQMSKQQVARCSMRSSRTKYGIRCLKLVAPIWMTGCSAWMAAYSYAQPSVLQ